MKPTPLARPQNPITPQMSPKRTTSRIFWATVSALAVATMTLVVVGLARAPSAEIPAEPILLEIPRTTLELLLTEAAETAHAEVSPDIDQILAEVYAPAYAAIPAYADFHYSVLGEYTELAEAAVSQMSTGLQSRLFAGFEQRLIEAGSLLDQRYADAYVAALKVQMDEEFTTESLRLPLGTLTQAALRDATVRARITAPLAFVAAGVAGSGTLRIVATAMATKLAATIVAKVAAKGIVKGGGALAGAGGGALFCSWSGPGAAACAVVGGVGAWLLTDAVIVNIDEYFNRDEFEGELRAILDDDPAAKTQLFEEALKKKALEMDKAAKTFKLDEWYTRESDN
jgi:uncharacterized protein YaaW (UPF0174 family)